MCGINGASVQEMQCVNRCMKKGPLLKIVLCSARLTAPLPDVHMNLEQRRCKKAFLAESGSCGTGC